MTQQVQMLVCRATASLPRNFPGEKLSNLKVRAQTRALLVRASFGVVGVVRRHSAASAQVPAQTSCERPTLRRATCEKIAH